ncbi:UNVERIFIED_ORG: putative lipoprotein NlpE involved in copper resistance [Arthrobacter globiformis]|nr:putative lipoprotein NlpE involved in copper resistance [Arthrobacter globiformis]
MKKIIAPVALVAILALTGCGGADNTSPAAVDSKAAQEAPKVPDLAGAWKQSNSNSEKSYQQATITADKITIEWVTDGGNTTSIYWVGTFKAPTSATEPYTWTSQRDVAATKSALLASSDATKEFKYEGGAISFKVSALGTTTTVNLKKN